MLSIFLRKSTRDLTTGVYEPSKSEYDIGRYDENRPGVYNTKLFEGTRTLHVGIDIGAPVNTPCMSFDQVRLPTLLQSIRR